MALLHPIHRFCPGGYRGASTTEPRRGAPRDPDKRACLQPSDQQGRPGDGPWTRNAARCARLARLAISEAAVRRGKREPGGNVRRVQLQCAARELQCLVRAVLLHEPECTERERSRARAGEAPPPSPEGRPGLRTLQLQPQGEPRLPIIRGVNHPGAQQLDAPAPTADERDAGSASSASRFRSALGVCGDDGFDASRNLSKERPGHHDAPLGRGFPDLDPCRASQCLEDGDEADRGFAGDARSQCVCIQRRGIGATREPAQVSIPMLDEGEEHREGQPPAGHGQGGLGRRCRARATAPPTTTAAGSRRGRPGVPRAR